jgi:hypothetical protein
VNPLARQRVFFFFCLHQLLVSRRVVVLDVEKRFI